MQAMDANILSSAFEQVFQNATFAPAKKECNAKVALNIVAKPT